MSNPEDIQEPAFSELSQTVGKIEQLTEPPTPAVGLTPREWGIFHAKLTDSLGNLAASQERERQLREALGDLVEAVNNEPRLYNTNTWNANVAARKLLEETSAEVDSDEGQETNDDQTNT
jgi:hypothetical protein